MSYEQKVYPVIILVDVSSKNEMLVKRAVDAVHKSLMKEPVYRE